MARASRLAPLQIPVALLGVLLIAWAATSLVSLPPPPPEGDGLPGGLAMISLYVVLWAGLIVLAVGLAVPGGGRWARTVSRGQRRLFLLSAAAAVASAILPFVATGVLLTLLRPDAIWLALLAWLIPAAVAVLALVGGLGWRALDAVGIDPFGE